MAPSLPPGPDLSGFMTTWNWIRRPFPFLEDCARKYGEVFTMRISTLPPFVVFSNPAAVKEVFADDGTNMHAGEMNKSLSAFLGDSSVLMLDGAEHLRHRRLLLPPFHGERMQKYAQTMIDETSYAMDEWSVGAPFAIHPHTQRITMRVILETVFGFRAGSERDRYEKLLKELLDLAAWPPLLLPAMQIDLGPWSPWGRFVRKKTAADRELLEEIAERRKRKDNRGDDVLSLLLSARDEQGNPMTDRELRDELTTLLVAGHETTATSIAWALRWILSTPSVEKKMREELESAGDLTPEKIAKLPYLDAVIKESMRMNPVIPIVGRLLKTPMKIGGWDLPAGVVAICSIYLAHRREDTWDRPWLFRPERFLEKKYGPNELFPFGGGIRRCIGMAFAIYEMKMVLATMLSRATLELAPTKPIVAVRRSITLAPSEGLRVRVLRMNKTAIPKVA